jgi:MerR family copper efflux transcriptional regulator
VLIADFCRTTGLPRDTVRYYEKLGLLNPIAGKGGTNSYLHYQSDDVERAAQIKLGQSLGFTLREIKDLMRSWESPTFAKEKRVFLMKQKIEQIDIRIAQLRSIKRYFKTKLGWIEGGSRGSPPAFRGTPVPLASKRRAAGWRR